MTSEQIWVCVAAGCLSLLMIANGVETWLSRRRP